MQPPLVTLPPPAGQAGVPALIDLSRDAILVMDAQRRIVYWSGGAARMFLYGIEEAVGSDCMHLLGFSHGGPFEAALEQTLAQGHWEGELVGYRKDGMQVVGLSRWQRVGDPGPCGHILISSTDIRLWDRFLFNTARGWLQNFDALFGQHPDGVVALDPHGNVLSVNPALCALTGYTAEELRALALHDLVCAEDAHVLRSAFFRARAGAPQTCDFTCRRRDGGAVDASVSLLPNMIAHHVVGVHGFIKDISERKRNEARILYLANHDALTGLPNRNLLFDRMQHAIEQARRQRTEIAVLFMDLNRFKIINDSLGHDKGDLLLCRVAQRLRGTLRDVDTVARLGGDEFVVMLEHIRDAAQVQQVAATLLEVVARPINLEGHNLRVTTSIGASLFPCDGTDPVTLLKSADLAMYAAKENGPGEFRFFESRMNDTALARLTRENNLHQAIERREFVLHYQPRLDVDTHAIVGLEALARWDHPTKGLIYPTHFIGLAEETGMIEALGEWVLREACRQLKEWIDLGLPSIKVSVNISPHQLQSGRLCATVAKVLAETGLDAELLELEITESSLMQDLGASAKALSEFQRMGISLAIDDFGTGYSSLSYLKRLPIDTLK
ncbi:MAG TPA: EAL domain-containing protein, partial [Noviherbaspirillum sp.]|nr:EAL domain-containing protein [Noviherbaspirillum sp.]